MLRQAFPCDQALLRALQVMTRNYHLLTSLCSDIAGTKTHSFLSGKDALHILGLKLLNPVILLTFLEPIYCCSAFACPHSLSSTLLHLCSKIFFLIACFPVFCSSVAMSVCPASFNKLPFFPHPGKFVKITQ